jgi:hypothetical protein
MLRNTLLLTAGLILLPFTACAQEAATPIKSASAAQVSYGSGTAAPQNEMKKDVMSTSIHAAWTDILKTYVSAPDNTGLTRFDYAGLKANAADYAKLTGYLEALGSVNPSALSRDEAIAFYANLYNALTIDLIVQNYPLDSIRKAKRYNGEKVSALTGPWKKTETSVNGKMLSLDEIEHGILRVDYPSPYIHYMVNCASVGCPNLLQSAWEADTHETLRKEAAAAYINSPRGVVVTSKGLKVSSIYKWFKEDFGGSKERVLQHIREYADADLAAAIDAGAEIVDYDYDWTLNE